MVKLTTHEDIKKYVMATIRSGNRERIQLVLKRYQEYLKQDKNSAAQDNLQKKIDIFKGL